MTTKSIGDYIDYLSKISDKLRDKDSAFVMLQENIEKLFQEYGFTNVERAEILAQINAAGIQSLDQFSTQGAIELIKTEKQNELVDEQKLKIAADIKLIEAQVKAVECETELNCLKKTLIPLEAEKLRLAGEELRNRVKLTDAQVVLVKRQAQNYNDNMLVKACEFQGGVTSYALNAAAPKMGELVEEFNKTIAMIKGRS